MALIPPFFLDCVVAIGKRSGKSLRWIASGFLYGLYLGPAEEPGKSNFRVFLITNRHVLEGEKDVVIRVNRLVDEPTDPIDVALVDGVGKKQWHGHPNGEVDVAAIPVNTEYLREHGLSMQFFHSNRHAADRAAMKSLGVSEGDAGYVLGFPMELAGEDRNYVIVRGGTVARVRDCLRGADYFLMDAGVFPGNSGGPVVVRPEIVSITGTTPVAEARLIGVVAAYVPFLDVAISQQTQRPRISFEENSGLAMVYPVDAIDDTIRAAMATESKARPPESAPSQVPPEGTPVPRE